MKSLTVVAVLASAASADTFRFPASQGHVEQNHPTGAVGRCASPRALRRLTNLVEHEPTFTLGHGQMTIWYKDTKAEGGAEHTYSTDHVYHDDRAQLGDRDWADFEMPHDDETGAWIQVLVKLDSFGWCREARTCAVHKPDIVINVMQHFDGAACYESWSGYGEKL